MILNRRIFIGRVLLAAALGLSAAQLCPAQEGDRAARIEREIVSARVLLATTTNDYERVQWEQRLALLEQDLKNIRRRSLLEDREKKLAAQHQQRAIAALREALHVVETDVAAPELQVKNLDRIINQLRTDRAMLEERRAPLEAKPDENAERLAEIDQRLRNLDEQFLARTLQRDAAELKVRVGGETLRIEEHVRTLPINPRPTVRLLLAKRQYMQAETKLMEEAATLIELLRQQRDEIFASLTLSKEKISHADAELQLLQKRMQYPATRAESRHLYYVTMTEKKLLSERVKHQEEQLTAIEQSLMLSDQLRDIYEKELVYLGKDMDRCVVRYRRLLVVPLSFIVGLFVFKLLISHLVLPRLYRKDNLFVTRRLANYLYVLGVILVLAVFFLEDLKQIATVLGIASAAIVIALQDLCSSFAGWFAIIASRKIQIGDRVEIEGHKGDVIDIQILRITLLEVNSWLGVDEATGRIIIIPNSFVFKTRVINYSHVHPYVWNKVDITVTFETPAAKAQKLFQKILEEENREELTGGETASHGMERRYGVQDSTYQPKVYSFIDDSGVRFSLVYVCHYRRISSVRNRINERIIAEFEADQELQFAYPTQRHIPTPQDGVLHVSVKK